MSPTIEIDAGNPHSYLGPCPPCRSSKRDLSCMILFYFHTKKTVHCSEMAKVVARTLFAWMWEGCDQRHWVVETLRLSRLVCKGMESRWESPLSTWLGWSTSANWGSCGQPSSRLCIGGIKVGHDWAQRNEPRFDLDDVIQRDILSKHGVWRE